MQLHKPRRLMPMTRSHSSPVRAVHLHGTDPERGELVPLILRQRNQWAHHDRRAWKQERLCDMSSDTPFRKNAATGCPDTL
jgi:hypothetical protein